MSKRFKDVPFLGSFHGSDVLAIYGGGDLTEYLINFVTNLDPTGNATSWPKWTSASPNMLSLNNVGKTVIKDVYRQDAMSKLTSILLEYPL